MNTHPEERSSDVFLFRNHDAWPTENVNVKDGDVEYSLVVHHFKHTTPTIDGTSRPTMVLLPEVVLDARTTWVDFITDNDIEPVMQQIDILLINYPGMALKSDGEKFTGPADKLPDFEALGRIVTAVINIKDIRGCMAAGTGLGASLIMRLASTDTTLFECVTLFNPPAAATPEWRKALESGYDSTKGFSNEFTDKWTTRWLQPSGERKYLSDVGAKIGSFFTSDVRDPLRTYTSLLEFSKRPAITGIARIGTPTLMVHGLAQEPEICLGICDASTLPNANLVAIHSNPLTHSDATREIALLFAALVYDHWGTLSTIHIERLLPTGAKVDDLHKTCTSRYAVTRIERFLAYFDKTLKEEGVKASLEEFRLNMAQSDWEGSRNTNGWWVSDAPAVTVATG
jgi:hypothetical protein